MNKLNKLQKTLGLIAGIAILVVAGVVYLINDKSAIGAEIYPKPFTNLIGTRTASTTVPVYWSGKYAATTTYPVYVGNADSASIIVDAVAASSTAGGAGVSIAIKGSNDPQCATSLTSSTGNDMLKNEIRWFDAGVYLANAAVTSSFSNATTTIGWINPVVGTQRVLNFQGLNVNCLALEVNASSTALFASYRLQE